MIALSSAVHGRNLVSCEPGVLDRQWIALRTQAFTPSAYACSPATVAGEYAASDRSAARARPIVRNSTSLGSAAEPSNSASVPLACRRSTSIWNSRSCACTQPCRNSASCSSNAWMCGMPSTSRRMRAGPCSSGSEIVGSLTCPGGLAPAQASVETKRMPNSDRRAWRIVIPLDWLFFDSRRSQSASPDAIRIFILNLRLNCYRVESCFP